MLNFQPELFKLASEERRQRLLAEATQWRMLRASHADGPQPGRSAWFWLRPCLPSLWRELTQIPIKPSSTQQV